MSRGRTDNLGILTFRPRVVSVIRRQVADGHQQEENKEKNNFLTNLEVISGPADETSTIRILGNIKEVLRESRQVGVNASRKVVDEDKAVRECKFPRKLLDEKKKKYKEIEHKVKKDTLVPGVNQIKNFSVALSKEDTYFIGRAGGHQVQVFRKIEQMTGARIEKCCGTYIRGSEEAVMKAKNILKKEEVILKKNQVTFLLRDGGKRMKSIEKESNTLIIFKGKVGDEMRPVTFIGTEIAIIIAKAILEEAVIIQTKIMLSSEINFLLSSRGKVITRIKNEAEVDVEVQGKRGNKGRAINVIGSKEAVPKAWAMFQNVLNKFEE